MPKDDYFVDTMPLPGVGKIFKPALSTESVRQQVTEELSVLLDQPFTIEVSIDKKFGQSLTITAPKEAKSAITETLGIMPSSLC